MSQLNIISINDDVIHEIHDSFQSFFVSVIDEYSSSDSDEEYIHCPTNKPSNILNFLSILKGDETFNNQTNSIVEFINKIKHEKSCETDNDESDNESNILDSIENAIENKFKEKLYLNMKKIEEKYIRIFEINLEKQTNKVKKKRIVLKKKIDELFKINQSIVLVKSIVLIY